MLSCLMPPMTERERTGPRRFRLSWRWKDSGVTGSGPWMHRGDIVAGWMESLTRRSGERVEHWIEIETAPTTERADLRAETRGLDRFH